MQFQVAYSAIVRGAGVIAAGPYYCARASVLRATTRCSCALDPTACAVSATSADVPELVRVTRDLAARGLIDDPARLAGQRVFLFSGGRDPTVPATLVDQLGDYFRQFMPAANIERRHLADAGHAMPTRGFGKGCGVNDTPWINDCDFDAAGALLEWIEGPLKPARTGPPRGRFIEFDQRPFIPGGLAGWRSGLDDSGWLYLPAACERGTRCRVHVALHGCRQGQSYRPLSRLLVGDARYGTRFVRNAGYDAWADSNDMIVIFPQASTVPYFNPNGCWDWWGYTGEAYAQRDGVQPVALRAMLRQLGVSGR